MSQVEQPAPIPNGAPLVKDLVIGDIEALCARRKEKYGTHLQPHNGRDSLQDAYEEAVDLALYLRACMEERKPATTREQPEYLPEDGWQPLRIDAIWTEHDDSEQPPVFGIATRVVSPACSLSTGDEYGVIRTRGPLFTYRRDLGNGESEIVVMQETTWLEGTFISEMRMMNGPELRARFRRPEGDTE